MEQDGLKFCILNIETNGSNYKKNNIIKLSWIISDLYFNILKQENFLINGNFEISNFIRNLTGISKEKTLKDGIALKDAYMKLYEDITQCQFMISHNISFYDNFINQEIKNLFENKLQNELIQHLNIFKSKIKLCSKFILQKECDERDYIIINRKLQTYHNYLVEGSYYSHKKVDNINMILECFQELDNLDILKYFWQKHLDFGKHKGKTNEWVYENQKEYFNLLLKYMYNVDTLYKKEQILYQDDAFKKYMSYDLDVDDIINENKNESENSSSVGNKSEYDSDDESEYDSDGKSEYESEYESDDETNNRLYSNDELLQFSNKRQRMV